MNTIFRVGAARHGPAASRLLHSGGVQLRAAPPPPKRPPPQRPRTASLLTRAFVRSHLPLTAAAGLSTRCGGRGGCRRVWGGGCQQLSSLSPPATAAPCCPHNMRRVAAALHGRPARRGSGAASPFSHLASWRQRARDYAAPFCQPPQRACLPGRPLQPTSSACPRRMESRAGLEAAHGGSSACFFQAAALSSPSSRGARPASEARAG